MLKLARYSLLLLCAVGIMPAAQAETKWTGGTTWRYLIRHDKDGLDSKDAAGKDTSKRTRKDHQIRADLNASNKGDEWDWGVGFRTFGSATSEWLSLNGSTDRAVTLENAYFRYHRMFGESELALTAGRAKTVLMYDSLAQGFWDKDNRWDGFGWTWKMSNFGLNAAQYYLGARNQGAFGSTTLSRTEASEEVATTKSGFAVLLSAQPFVKFKLSDELEGLLAVGYHVWSGTQGNGTAAAYTNSIHGGTAAPTTAANLAGDNRDAVIMDNARQWQVLTDWSLPHNFRFVGEYVMNKKVRYGTFATPTTREAQRSMLALSLGYGKIKKAHDWSLSYSYVAKGIASVHSTFSNSNQAPDTNGHLISGAFALADGMTLGAKMELYKEKALLGGDGLALTGAGVNRKQSQNRYEFTAGLAF